jgi:hypothetical protein
MTSSLPSWPQIKQKGKQLAAAARPAPLVTPEGKPIPEAVTPHPEGRAPYIPYRGPNVHGGPNITQSAFGPTEQYGDGSVDVEWNVPEAPDHVVPVRIIQDAKEQITNFRAGQTPTGDNAQMIFNRMRNRTELKIKNLAATGGNACWIGADESIGPMNGYRLDPGEVLTLTSTEDVWAINVTPGAPVTLSWILHYTQAA